MWQLLQNCYKCATKTSTMLQLVYNVHTCGCWQGKVDKKNSPPKVQLKNGIIFYMDTRK
jgi:hypothetical protein